MELGISLISVGIAFLSVGVAVYSVREARKAVITGTYFSEMVNAYADYLKCVTYYVYQPGHLERNALVASLYRLSLYAPTAIHVKAHDLYCFVIDWAHSEQTRALAVDDKINQLRELMYETIATVRRNGHF